MANLNYSKLELQPYLKCDILYNRTKKFLFKLRTRMVNVANNFGKKDLNYNNIFETDTQKQAEIAKILERAFRIREEIIDELTN